MRKLVLLVFFCLLFINCSSDSNDIEVSFVGTWQYQSLTENGIISTHPCTQMNNFSAESNGSVTLREFDDSSGNCILDNTLTGNWTDDGNSKFTVNLPGGSAQFTQIGNTITATSTVNNITSVVVWVKI